ncbi:LamG-like jellyroll fold domain-containing protein [Microbacterium sp.]|uniref:LamG-like jellyroll fold domain-containing protein n=1 Tax=Microbacterium sp. TaxID=51671 RepID=UPI0027354C2A|nr:LamG-like jellyroll fold domain-containing protein [Microbacterium sp.]MDP3950548.1 LamG-like jellyroll fold domain-containing protein [Microbacterium sp.]
MGLTTSLLMASALPASAQSTVDEGADLASRFTFAVLPDTQFYSRYSAEQFQPRYGTDPFATQTQWIAENADALRIPFTAHVGDVVDRASVEAEWQAADNAMKNLEAAGASYSILTGNHDVLDSNDALVDTDYDLTAEPFLRWFGTERAAADPSYQGSDPTGFSRYHVFEAEGQEFMVLTLPWRVSDATLAWADSVMAEHPTLPVILTSHEVLNVEADGATPRETDYGLMLWDKLIAGNDQIFLTFNGHFHGASRLTKINDFGHEVHEVLIDYQMAYEGGNGYLGLLEFDLTNGQINAQTASPWVVSKPQETLTSYDQPFLEGAQQQYSIDIDFAERFAGFNPTFGEGTTPDEPSLTQRARDILLDGFEGPDPISTELPGDERDFVEAEGTVAHWRFNGLDGVVDADTVIEDVAGDNDLRRVNPASTDAVGAEWGDVAVESADVHGFSSDGAAVCFADSSATRYSYLSTAPDAVVNDVDLSDGYTIETFVKLDDDWNAAQNGWSKALVRTGNRSWTEMPPSRWDYTASPTALGISNLREFQYSSLSADAAKGDRVNWSGEIMTGSWSHVAIVNDPETQTTTMYVDGAPVLRNAVDTVGMTWNEGMPWILGADWVDDAARNGWHGCIGETRIIDRATTPADWLTQRADLSGLQVSSAPSGVLPAGTESVTFSGTGLPGADIDVAMSAPAADTAVAAVTSTPSAAAVVDANGRWTLTLTGLSAGSYDAQVTQSLGARASDPVTAQFSIAAIVEPTPTPIPTAPGEGGGSGSDSGNGSAGTAEGALPATGLDQGLLMSLLALGGALLAVGATIAVRARRRMRG